MKEQMKISYLIGGFGHTGGSMVLYNFMDKLCERGYRVFAITPNERIEWQRSFSQVILNRLGVPPKPGHRDIAEMLIRQGKNESESLVDKGERQLLDSGSSSCYRRTMEIVEKPFKRYARKIAHKVAGKGLTDLQSFTKGLIQNWTEADVTVATFCLTSYAMYALMDKTTPLYHMQHFEELIFDDEFSQKAARLTYYMPFTLLANSSWLRTQIQDRVGRESFLLNPGIDTGRFYPRADLENKYRDLKRIRIVSYYSHVRFKAWDDAVEAMRIVFSRVGENKAEWVVYGGAPATLPDLAVQFVGAVFGEALARLYSTAHIVFMNSWYESFPFPPIEAMACGTAVVTTRMGTEDYAFDGENSLVVPPRQPHLLATAILRLIEQPSLASQLAQNGVDTARQFTWDKATDCLEAIILKATSNYARARFADIPELVSGKF